MRAILAREAHLSVVFSGWTPENVKLLLPPPGKAGGFSLSLHANAEGAREWFYVGMNRSRCQRPPASADGGSRGSCSPAEVLSQPGLPVDVLDLRVPRSRAAVLWRGVPAPGPSRSTSRRQPAASAERRGPAGSSRPPARLSLPAVSMPRDGSRFPIRSIRNAGPHETESTIVPLRRARNEMTLPDIYLPFS